MCLNSYIFFINLCLNLKFLSLYLLYSFFPNLNRFKFSISWSLKLDVQKKEISRHRQSPIFDSFLLFFVFYLIWRFYLVSFVFYDRLEIVDYNKKSKRKNHLD
jgi:hypothetical protein